MKIDTWGETEIPYLTSREGEKRLDHERNTTTMTVIHRTSTDGKTTICGVPALPGQSVGVHQPNKVTCPPCARNATTTHDPANWMLKDGVTSSTTVYNGSCYICRDPEFAAMGLPLCTPCPTCGAHTPADDTVCDNGHDTYPAEYGPSPDGVPQVTDVPTGEFL